MELPAPAAADPSKRAQHSSWVEVPAPEQLLTMSSLEGKLHSLLS